MLNQKGQADFNPLVTLKELSLKFLGDKFEARQARQEVLPRQQAE